MYLKLVLSVIFSFLLIPFVSAQVGKNDLVNQLSVSDKKNIQKIETVSKKGNDIEIEALKIKEDANTEKDQTKSNKKYSLKRLEASQYYQKANSDFISLLKDNIDNFWKKNKNLQISSVKNYEDKAGELTRKAKSIRYVAEDLFYPDEKLSKILEAEEIEKEAIEIYIKVLYAYLNQPVDYDVIKLTDNIDTVQTKIDKSTSAKNKSNESEVNYIPVDSSQPKDSVIKKEPELALSSHLNTIKPTISQSTQVNKDSLSSKPADLVADNGGIYEKMEVKEDQVDKFNKFLADSFPDNYENYIINFRSLDYSNVDSLRDAWRRYLYAYPYSDATEISKKPELKDSTLLAVSNTPLQKTKSTSNNTSQNSKSHTKNGKKTVANSESKLKNRTNVNDTNEFRSKKEIAKAYTSKNTNQAVADGFVYRVQICACRISVDSLSLQNIYNGDYKILELNEDNWFKYAIGELNTYTEAKELREKINVPGAFVIAYLHGKRINVLHTPISQYNSFTDSSLVYKVQIAASKVQLNKKYVDQIYNGPKKVEEIFEDGWYKYGVTTGPSLNVANRFIDDENIPGAFITSYLGNKKIELREAIRLNNKNRNK